MASEVSPPLILIVDDTPANIKILTGLLKTDYRIGFATNGAKALAFADEHRPDLILLDIMMPEMDGYEVCRILKSNTETASIPVLFISVLDGVDNKTKGFAVGGADYIAKPFEEAEVTARVKTHLSLKRHQDQLKAAIEKRTAQLMVAKAALESKAHHLEEANTALKVLLRNLDTEKKAYQENILHNVNNLVTPWIQKIKDTSSATKKDQYLEILEQNINELISPFSGRLRAHFMNFTLAEVQIANLIKQNKSTKEIAELLNLSTHTIDSHRKHIREKLGITNKRVNLKIQLDALDES